MKTNIIIITLCVSVLSGKVFSQGSIEVTVKNIKEAKGNIRVGLFNSEADFLEKAIEGKVVKTTGTEVTVVFENLKPGDYAVSIIHDENENGDLDKNFMGIPKEGFAFGNNAMGTFGPPDFKEAKVSVGNEKVKQVISMKYM
ncbi:MAG TPA: DUF2141 domain-containing protein [Ohtaekwangia sp.]